MIVGVNKYTVANEVPPPVRVIDNSAVLKAQVAKLKQVKESRDPARAAKALEGVRAAAADSSLNLLGDLFPPKFTFSHPAAAHPRLQARASRRPKRAARWRT